jgi:hypothetical protein
MLFRNPFGPQKLPAGLAKFPGCFPVPFPAVRHREFCFKPLLQFHKLDANRLIAGRFQNSPGKTPCGQGVLAL